MSEETEPDRVSLTPTLKKWGQYLAAALTGLVAFGGGAMKVGRLQERLDQHDADIAGLEATDNAILERVRNGEKADAGVAEALRGLRAQQERLIERFDEHYPPRMPRGRSQD